MAIKKITGALEQRGRQAHPRSSARAPSHLKHENVIRIVDVVAPPALEEFTDVYVKHTKRLMSASMSGTSGHPEQPAVER